MLSYQKHYFNKKKKIKIYYVFIRLKNMDENCKTNCICVNKNGTF